MDPAHPWLPFETHPVYAWALLAVMIFGAITFAALFFVTAPYGRHFRDGWGPSMPAKLGWILMEAPSPIGFACVYWQSEHALASVPLVLFAFWQTHYFWRAFVFPLLMRGAGKRKPVLTVLLAVAFNCCNGALNAYAITHLAPHLWSADWLLDPRFIVGVALFASGGAINQHSDHLLRHLREPGATGYSIPRGGAFRWVTSPNYLGEILEWLGFALAAWTLAAAVFAAFTAANLVPRAISHHRWYHEQFQNYPASRRAIVPYIL